MQRIRNTVSHCVTGRLRDFNAAAAADQTIPLYLSVCPLPRGVYTEVRLTEIPNL